MSFILKFILPIRFNAFNAASLDFLHKNWGVYSTYMYTKNNAIIEGIVMRIIVTTLQLGII